MTYKCVGWRRLDCPPDTLDRVLCERNYELNLTLLFINLEDDVNVLGEDWIVHLDEETLLTESSVSGIVNYKLCNTSLI